MSESVMNQQTPFSRNLQADYHFTLAARCSPFSTWPTIGWRKLLLEKLERPARRCGMSELKFSCPACGQHISCSKAAGGHVIHCPACCAEMRIPLGSVAGNSELKAELI